MRLAPTATARREIFGAHPIEGALFSRPPIPGCSAQEEEQSAQQRVPQAATPTMLCTAVLPCICGSQLGPPAGNLEARGKQASGLPSPRPPLCWWSRKPPLQHHCKGFNRTRPRISANCESSDGGPSNPRIPPGAPFHQKVAGNKKKTEFYNGVLHGHSSEAACLGTGVQDTGWQGSREASTPA